MEVRLNKRLKTPRLLVKEDGSVFLECNEKDIKNKKLHSMIIEENKNWIKAQIELKEKNRPHPTEKTYEMVNGATIYVLGKPYKLKIAPETDKSKIVGKYLHIKGNRSKEEIEAFFKSNYTSLISEKKKVFEIRLGLKDVKINLVYFPKMLGRNNGKYIDLNWKILMLSPELVDYVILHELVHFKVMNHGKSFWSEIEKQMPDYKDRENKVKNNIGIVWNFNKGM